MNDGGPDFPLPIAASDSGDIIATHEAGMSLRDYFAGQALQGMCANPAILTPIRNKETGRMEALFSEKNIPECYAVADRMLQARQPKLEPSNSSRIIN